MRLGAFIVFVFFGLLTGCKKKQSPPQAPDPEPIPLRDTSPFKCQQLPETPAPFGWYDSIAGPNREINAFMYNPANPDEIVVVVNGDAFGYNKMYYHNIPQGKTKLLSLIDNFNPSVNKNGWVLFSTVDRNIFKIKCNGDSITQLTSGNTTQDPKWDYSGDFFYYYQAAYSNVPTQVVKATHKGIIVYNTPAYLPHTAPFKKSNKIIYHKVLNATVTLFIKDIEKHTETALITATYSPKSEDFYFDNLCLDNNDEFVYWSNSSGILKCSLITLNVDTVFKNCPSVLYQTPLFQPTHPNEILFCAHFFKPLNSQVMYHDYKPVIMNVISKDYQFIDIFD